MAFDVFPTDSLFDPETEDWKLRANTINGGVTVGGIAQIARTDGGGLWSCEQTGIEIWTTEQLLAASALDMQLEGGVSPIVVPCFNWPLRPVPEGMDWTVSIALTAEAALRATTLTVVIATGAPLRGGEPFSVVHENKGKRLYRVRDAEPAVTVDGITTQTVTIRPPLRELTAAGTAMDFETPGCLMRLANPDAWLSPLDAAHERTAQPVWIEHFAYVEPEPEDE